MSETIIIESNREIAYKDQLEAFKNTTLGQDVIDFPNYKWTTQVQSGIPLEVGDQISVEATMIQQKGSPEETIEFSGDSNIKNAFGYVDNAAELKISFYITNRQQFNCPLPLYDMNIKNSVADASTLNFGLPDLTTFANFKKAYPYRGIEGMYKDGNDYKEVDGGGVFSRPPQPLDDTSPLRLYLWNRDGNFKSFQTADGDIMGKGLLPNQQFEEFEISVPAGFNTPENVAQRITEQFHQRDGDPANDFGWDETYVNGVVFKIDTTTKQIGGFTNSVITDKCYKTVATATGDLLYGREQGRWATKFAGENGNEGDNYTEAQGLEFLYKNILVGDQPFWISSILLMGVRSGNFNSTNVPQFGTPAFDEAGTYTGHDNIVSGMGTLGCFPCILDNLDSSDSTETKTYPTNRTTTATIADIKYLKMESLELIVTNIAFSYKGRGYLANALMYQNIPTVGFSPSTPFSEDNQYKFYNSNLQFGRADDDLSLGASNKKVLLPCPRSIKSPANLPNSYQTVNGQKCLVGFANNASNDTAYSLRIKTYWKPTLNQNLKNPEPLTLPSNSLFTLKDSKGNYGNFDEAASTGAAIIPVFYKEDQLPDPALKDVPFCAVINADKVRFDDPSVPIRIPLPAQGEFFGYSPSMYDHLLSKVVTTQKVLDFDSGAGNYPDHTEINTRTYSYYPYCMIGADNPTMAYDDNSSRISLKDFHTAVRAGNGVFQEPLDKANEQASLESMVVNGFEAAISGTADDGSKIPYINITQTEKPFPVISSQSGIALESIFLKTVSGAYEGTVTPLIPETFTGTLFEKLGFIAEQLIPFTGVRQNQFNRGNYNLYLGNKVDYSYKYNNMVLPFTTNAYISGSDALSMSRNAKGQQMENLGAVVQNQSTFVNAESDELIALNLPSKLDYPYLVVYSNIVRNTKFLGGANGQQQIPAMGYISRNYSTGDYFYSFATGWTYTIDKPYILTDFTTQIMLPDGTPAPIERNSSVVYKIIKQKTLPPPPLELIQPPKKSKEQETKEKTKK